MRQLVVIFMYQLTDYFRQDGKQEDYCMGVEKLRIID